MYGTNFYINKLLSWLYNFDFTQKQHERKNIKNIYMKF